MPPSPLRPEAAPHSVSTSRRVMPGSAPPGTFSIPEDGLPIPESKSFLARFKQGLAIRMTNAEKAVAKAAVAHREYVADGDDDAVSNGNATGNVKAVSIGADHGDSTKHSHATVANADPVIATSPDPVLNTNTVHSSTKKQEQVQQLASNGVEGNTNEVEADKTEDTLIKVVSNSESLLQDDRASYPVLRFCAANGLIDQHFLDALGLPLGFVWSPFGGLRNVRRVDRLAKRCGTCGSFIAKGNGAEDVLKGSRLWTCSFCGRNDNDAGEAGLQANITPQTFPELVSDTVEYSHPDSAVRQPSGCGAIVLILDENVEPEEAEWARAATATVYASALEKGMRFALITVGAGCSVAVRQLDPNATPVLEMMSPMRASTLSAEEKEKFFLDQSHPELHSSESRGSKTAYSLNTDAFISARVPWEEENRPPADGTAEAVGEGSTPRRKTRYHPDVERRRLDAALLIALELISGMADTESSRVLSLVTGPPTLPQQRLQPQYSEETGATKDAAAEEGTDMNVALAKLFEQIGQKAGDMRIGLDFLCYGAANGFAGPVLLAAARRSRGGIVYTAAHSFSAASALSEAAAFLAQRSTSPGVISIRVSSPFTVARVIGPAFPTAAPHTYAVPGIDPTTGFTVILQSKSDPNKDKDTPSHAVVQLAAKSMGATRVVTARIPVTSHSEDYLNGLDPEICALVLGKACVVSGGALIQPMIAARSIDVSARRLLRGSEATVGVVRLLYELRRGLMIEKQVHPDCALVLRSFFLRADYSIASLLMSPRLFTNAKSDEGTGLMAEVPLEKSYITNSAVLVLDTGFNVFVYVGNEASPDAEEAISESARAVAAQRISPCQLWKLRPGPDAEYLLDSYLSPKDPSTGGGPATPVEQGFVQYCKSLAPDSITVRLLQNA